MGMGNVILGRFDNGAIFGALPPPPPPVQIGRRNAAHSILWERYVITPLDLVHLSRARLFLENHSSRNNLSTRLTG